MTQDSVARTTATPSRSPSRHYGSLRNRVLRVVALVLLLGIVLGAGSIVQNARHAIRAEGESFAMFAVNLLESVLMAPQNRSLTRAEFQPYLDAVADLRHVSVTVYSPAGTELPPSEPIDAEPTDEEAPGWFRWLLTWQQADFFRGVINGGPRIGRVVVTADPTDEINEVWEDVQPLMVVVAGLFLLVGALLYRAVHHGLAPLQALLGGFERLRRAEFPVEVDENVVEELHSIHTSFNWLAATLQQTLHDNMALAAHMVDLREEERLALARELHDELAPFLFGIKMQLATVARNANVQGNVELRQKIATVTGMSADLERVVRRMLHRLRPSTLDDLGLTGALADLVDAWRERHAPIGCELNVARDADGLDDTTRVTVYRAVQECLTNVAKHAVQVRTVSITLQRLATDTKDADSIELVVSDDGARHGEPHSLGFGLLGMQERVRALGGTMAVERPDGAGFTIRIRLPVERTGTTQTV